MKYIYNILLLVFLCSMSCFVDAAGGPVRTGKPEDVVNSIYRNFIWEITEDIGSRTVLIEQPITVLEQYFSPKLAQLIVNDRKYVERTKEVGHLDFILLSGSQDPIGISNIRINRKHGTNIVTVLYDQNGEKDVMKIDNYCIHTKKGWRISDMHYISRESKSFPVHGPESSLLELLSQPY